MPNVRLGQTAWKLVQSPVIVFALVLAGRLWVAAQLLPDKAWLFFYRYNEPSRIAWSLVTGHGFSSPWPNTPLLATAQQPPLYPFLVAGIFRLFGAYSLASLWTAILLNSVFSALTAVAILQLGKRILSPLAGVLAAWTWCCWLYESAVAIRVWESALSGLLLTVALLLLPKLASSLRPALWLLFGLLAGAAALNNTTLLAVFIALWVWLWASYYLRGRSCNRRLLASFATCVLILVPWTIRNYASFDRLVPIRDNFGLELWLGNHEGEALLTENDFQQMVADYRQLGELRFMDTKRQIAVQFIRQHPESFFRLSCQRVFKYWTAPRGSVWIFISLLAWLGMFLALWNRGMEALPYAAVLIVFPLVYYFTHTGSTYRHPCEPVMLVLAAYASVTAFRGSPRYWADLRRRSQPT